MLYTYQKILRMHSPRLYSRTSQSWGRQLLPAAWSLQNNWRTEWKCGWSAVCSSVSGRRRSGQIWLSLYRKCTVKSEHSIDAYTIIQSLRKQPLTSQISKFLFAVCVSCFHICGSVFVHPGKIFFPRLLEFNTTSYTKHHFLSDLYQQSTFNEWLFGEMTAPVFVGNVILSNTIPDCLLSFPCSSFLLTVHTNYS